MADIVFVLCLECGYEADDSNLDGTTSSGACRCCGGNKLRWSNE